MLNEEGGKFIKLKLKGKKLKGLWVARQQEGAKMWTFRRARCLNQGKSQEDKDLIVLFLEEDVQE